MGSVWRNEIKLSTQNCKGKMSGAAMDMQLSNSFTLPMRPMNDDHL